MDKQELLTVLNTGLAQNRITEEEYNHALHLYTLIYEKHTASECGVEHASLAALINKASGTDEETLKARMRSEYEAAMAVIMDTNIAAKIRSTGILKTLQDAVEEGRISCSEFSEHQDLARQLVEMIEADAEKLADIKKRMDEILAKAAPRV